MNLQFNKFEIVDVIRESWEIFKKHLGMVLLGWVLAMVANIAIAMGLWMIHVGVDLVIALLFGLPAAAAFDSANSEVGKTTVGIALMSSKLITQIFFQIVQTVMSMFVTAGLLSYFIKFARTGEPPDLKTLIVYDKRILNLVLFQIILVMMIFALMFITLAPGGVTLGLAIAKTISFVPSIILGSLGLIVLIAGIIYIQLVTSQVFYLIVDKHIGPVDALTLSNEAMKGNKLNLFLLGLLMSSGGMVIILCTCFIGFIFVAPFSLLIMAKVYTSIVSEDFFLEKNTEVNDTDDEVYQYDADENFYR